MAQLAPLFRQRFLDANGDPLVGGKLNSYVANTTTPLATYTDASGNFANANPVILDANGEADVWLASGAYYKFILFDADDNLIDTIDNVSLPGTGASGSSFLTGSGVPDDGDGNDGDTYLDSDTGQLYHKTDGVWDPGEMLSVGDVQGPASSVDDRIATFDGLTGKVIQDGGQTIAGVLARANHTGDQTASTISDFSSAADARIAAASINALADVDTVTTPPNNGEVLLWDTDKWVPGESSGGGGGSALVWRDPDTYAPLRRIVSLGLEVFDFSTDGQDRFCTITVPESYVPGTQIKLIGGKFFSALTSGNALFKTNTRRFVAGIAATSIPTGHVSTNAQQAVDATTNEIVGLSDLDLTNASGQINAVAVQPLDLLVVNFLRDVATETSGVAGDVSFIFESLTPKFTA